MISFLDGEYPGIEAIVSYVVLATSSPELALLRAHEVLNVDRCQTADARAPERLDLGQLAFVLTVRT